MVEKRVRIIVAGRVQGVWYRASTVKKAEELELTGWVKNLADESVEILAEGPEEKLVKLASWSKKGPPSANITEQKITWEPYTGEFPYFSITY
ncbi:MAG: acylphosphatase [Candidatus Altiarchaeota archaeon]